MYFLDPNQYRYREKKVYRLSIDQVGSRFCFSAVSESGSGQSQPGGTLSSFRVFALICGLTVVGLGRGRSPGWPAPGRPAAAAALALSCSSIYHKLYIRADFERYGHRYNGLYLILTKRNTPFTFFSVDIKVNIIDILIMFQIKKTPFSA